MFQEPKKCPKQRIRQERIYKRPNRGPFQGDCGQVPADPYEVHINIDPATKPCSAVTQLIREEIRFSDRFFIGSHCPTNRIKKVRKFVLNNILSFSSTFRSIL